MPTFIFIESLAGLFFLITYLRSGQSPRGRAHTIEGLAAVLLLSSAGLDLYWYLHVGHLRSWAMAAALYSVRHLLHGAIVAILAPILHAESTKFVLMAAAVIFMGFVVLAAVLSEIRHLPLTIPFLCFSGLPIGMSIPAVILVWLDNRGTQGLDKGEASSLAARS